jgi:hypothetical protein
VPAWTDRRIELKLPDERAPAVPWHDGDRVTVRVVANGSEATALGHFVYRKSAAPQPSPPPPPQPQPPSPTTEPPLPPAEPPPPPTEPPSLPTEPPPTGAA